jgi:hypothetical protein
MWEYIVLEVKRYQRVVLEAKRIYSCGREDLIMGDRNREEMN